MKKYAIILTSAIILFLTVSCKDRPAVPLNYGYPSYKKLVEEMSEMLAKRKETEFRSKLLTKTEFEKSVYSMLPESQQKNPFPANEYWMMSIYNTDKALVNFYYKFRDSKSIQFKKMGEPQKVKRFGHTTVYNFVPVYFSDESGRQVKLEKLYSAIVCVEDSCRLWSVDVED